MRYVFIVFLLLLSSMSYNTIATAKTVDFATLEAFKGPHPVDVSVDHNHSDIIVTALEAGTLSIEINEKGSGNHVYHYQGAVQERSIIVIRDLPSKVYEVTTILNGSTRTVTVSL